MCAGLLGLLTCVPAFAQSIRITDYAIADIPPVVRRSIAAANGPRTLPVASVSFVAFGKRFDMTLEPNDRVTRNLRTDQRAALADVELLRGTLRGHEDSWVRLTRSPGRVSGLIWDGAELYGIDPFGDVAPHLARQGGAAGGVVIYRWSDVTGSFADLAGPAALGVAGMSSLAFAAGPLFAPAKQVDIGLVGDFEFVRDHPSSATTRMLEIVNNVDAILVRQLGVHLSVGSIELFDTDTDPFTSANPGTLLAELESHKETTPELRARGLAHLFTRRDLVDPQDATRNIVGAARLGSVCDVRTSVGFSKAYFAASVNAVITAHEFGHNFGAPHDAEAGSPCEATPPTFLMASTVSQSEEFSACSIGQIQPVLLGASCLTDIAPADVAVQRASPSPNPLVLRLGGSGQLGAHIVNTGATDALAVDLTVAATGIDITRIDLLKEFQGDLEYSCTTTPRRCHIPRLPPGKLLRLLADIATTDAGVATLTFASNAANDGNAANNAFQFSIDVQAAVDVDIEDPDAFAARPSHIRPLDTTWVEFDLVNRSPITATAVLLRVGGAATQLEMVDAARDGCTQTGGQIWECPVGTIASSQSKHIALEFRARPEATGSQFVSFNWTSAEQDVDLGADNDHLFIEIHPKVVDLEVTLDSVASGAPAVFKAVVTNHGPDVATNVELWYASPWLVIQSITSDRGACGTNNATNWVCRVAALALGETMTMTISGNGGATPSYRAWLDATAAEVDADDSNNHVDQHTLPSPPPAPPPSPPSPPPPSPPASSGGGGGGGASDLWVLSFLCVVLAWHRRVASRTRWSLLQGAFLSTVWRAAAVLRYRRSGPRS